MLDCDDPLSEESLPVLYQQRNRDREYSVDIPIIKRFADYYADFKIPEGMEVISSFDLTKAQNLIDLVLNFKYKNSS